MATYDNQVFARNLQYYMNLNQKKRKEVCEALGVHYNTFSDWLYGRKFPRIDKIEMLADYFGIEKSDLIEDKRNIVHPEEDAIFAASILRDEELLEMIRKFRNLSEKSKNAVIQMIDTLSE